MLAAHAGKIENENNNVLKNHGYHLEHNFGHGKAHLSNVLFTVRYPALKGRGLILPTDPEF